MSSLRIPGSPTYVVAKILSGFAGEWAFVHDQDLGKRGARVDHILVGSFGVLCLTARRQGGAVVVTAKGCEVDGGRLELYGGVRRDASTVASRLKATTGLDCPVRPVVVMVGTRLIVESQPEDVKVVTDEALVLWLRSLPQCLDEVQQRVFSAALVDAATWTPRSRRAGARSQPPAPAPERALPRASAQEWALFETWAVTGDHRFYVHDPDGRCLAYYDVRLGELVMANENVRGFAQAMLGPHMRSSPRIRTDATIAHRTRSRP